MKTNFDTKIFVFFLLTIISLFSFKIHAQIEENIALELPENLLPAYEQLNDLIGNEQKLLDQQKEDLTKYTNLSSSTKYQIESDLSDLTTRLSQIESTLQNPEGADNYTQVIIDTHAELFRLNESLKEKTIDHKEAIENDIFKSYLKQHKETLDGLNFVLISEDIKSIDIGEIIERYRTVEDVMDELENEYLESTWVRFEEKLQQLKEAINDYLEE